MSSCADARRRLFAGDPCKSGPGDGGRSGIAANAVAASAARNKQTDRPRF